MARSSTSFVDAPSRTKLLRLSIIAGAPVERGVKGSELAVESMALTIAACRGVYQLVGTRLEFRSYALVLSPSKNAALLIFVENAAIHNFNDL